VDNHDYAEMRNRHWNVAIKQNIEIDQSVHYRMLICVRFKTNAINYHRKD